MRRLTYTDFVDFNHAKLQLLTTELDVGHTFATIALGTHNGSTRSRNRGNARKAYDFANRWAREVTVTHTQAKEIQSSLARLKSELRSLGETDLA